MRQITLISTSFFSLFLITTFFASAAHAQTCPIVPSSNNTASFSVVVPQTGTYTYWGRMIAPDSVNNSYFLQVDGGCAVVVGDSPSIPVNQFTWVNYQDGNAASPITMELAAGAHTVVLTEKEGGIGIDTVFFTDTPCVPTGFGENCQGFVTFTPAPTVEATATPLPTVTPSVQTYTINPIADAYIDSKRKNKNFGTNNVLNVDGNPVNTAYLKFDLTPLAGKTVVTAKLRIRTSTDNSSNQQRVKPVSNITWNETTITYNNRPTVTNTILGTINSSGATNAWQEVPLTGTVASNVGKIFSLAIDTSGSNNIWFSSRESTSEPELVIEAQ